MLTIENIRKRLQDMDIDAVAKKTGLHRNTVNSVKRGNTASYRTVVALSEYMEARDREFAEEHAAARGE